MYGLNQLTRVCCVLKNETAKALNPGNEYSIAITRNNLVILLASG